MFKKYNEYITVNENGKVIKLKTIDSMGRITNAYEPKPHDNGNGYQYISVNYGGKLFHFAIHRLVAELFVDGNSDENTEVHHIDGNKLNNNYKNLRWVSKKEHNARGVDAVERAIETKIKKYGKPFKLTKKGISLSFNSVQQAADYLGVSRTAVRLVLKGTNKTVKGYTGKYLEENNGSSN